MPYDLEDPDSLQQRDDHNGTHGEALIELAGIAEEQEIGRAHV